MVETPVKVCYTDMRLRLEVFGEMEDFLRYEFI